MLGKIFFTATLLGGSFMGGYLVGSDVSSTSKHRYEVRTQKGQYVLQDKQTRTALPIYEHAQEMCVGTRSHQQHCADAMLLEQMLHHQYSVQDLPSIDSALRRKHER